MLLNALIGSSRQSAWAQWKQSRFAQFSAAFFLIYLLSGFWSDDLNNFWPGIVNKIPFLILPFAFFTVPLHQIKFQRLLIFSIVAMHFAVVLYSVYSLWQQPEFYIKGYEFSHPLPTTKYNDHIRFSITLVFSCLMSCYLIFDKRHTGLKNSIRMILAVLIIIFIAYLHLLAAKSGLVCLYLFLLVYGFYLLYRRSKWLAGLLVVIIFCMPMVMYQFVPTFQKKMDYVGYEIDKYKSEKHFDYSLSDGGRMITYDIGLRAIARQPLLGVGAGDLMEEMRKGYQKYYPEVPVYEQYGPINQFLYTALCVGIPLGLITLFLVLSPFFCTGHYRIYISVSALILLFCLLVEAMLEIQFGVFTYLYFLLFWLCIYQKEKSQKTKSSVYE